jgi:proton-translocating NADH-quinone oxidoreductase chain N
MAALLNLGPQDMPIDLTIVLGTVGLIIVILAVLGNKSKPIAMGLASGGFAFGIAFIVLQALGYFGSQSSLPYLTPTASTPVATDWVSYLFGLAILIVAFLVGLTVVDYFADESNVTTFYALLVFTTIGALLLAFSTDLLMVFVAWELMSIPSYVLTGFKKRDPASNEAAVKYFLVSAFASAVLLYGISLIYLLTGTTSIYGNNVGNSISSLSSGAGPVGILALTFLLAGFGIKLAAVPFHMWIPDAYQGAPTIVSGLLSTATKGATFAPAARIFFVIFSFTAFHLDWSLTFAVLAVLSMTLGNFAALTQRSVTRILAYSSIGQAGYILIGFAAGGTTGLTGSFFHIINYSTMQVCAFLAVALIIRGTRSDDLGSFDGLGRRMVIAPLALTLSLLALGGFPPLSGFWSKLTLFLAAINSPYNLSWLAVVGIINSFVSIAFYVRIVKHMYLDPAPNQIHLPETNGFKIALVISILVIVGTGIYPYPVIQLAETAAKSFLGSAVSLLPF